MKFSAQPAIAEVASEQTVVAGNVYRSKGGKGTSFWVIVAVRGTAAHALGLDENGEIVSSTSYGCHAFQRRELIGFCEELQTMELNIAWRVEP